ncbi:Ku protein [Amycolatopsis rubida]|uniref:Non-homologous end joining protein Ku n=1 Tax=Amycolatopsis rubida TaxID=112413 RepID=A0A1I6AQX1_9PSEU|nr:MULTISPECIES: Ku protein [Amycolatopsis]MYW93174.1 Ku protein [Amycolatopsis rubida]NEC58161.1 Ku protein [Amycolatopsis rubida]OAP24413.1 putative DNA repair protein YkoV [Amycolatopsis sp. M39]SFQ71103.1 DNA end-binding protein Ku [Amycolatopsis rubida]
MRPVWQGALSFGLVNVPVRMYKAVEDHAVRFTQFQRGTRDRIRYRRVNERTGDEVPYDEIVRGREVGDDEYVLVEQEELDEIAPGRSRSLEVESFVDLDEVDPVYFDRAYWLAPAKEEAQRPYVLLLDALSGRDKAAVAKFVFHGREHLALARAGDGVIVLNTLHYAAEVRSADDVPQLPAKAKTNRKELDLAVKLIDAMTEPWKPEEFRDTYRERVEELIEAKRAGNTVTPAAEPEQPTKVVDLMEALAKSVRGSRKPRTPDLSGLSKTELRKLAKERDVKGRSKMSRADLEAALKAS